MQEEIDTCMSGCAHTSDGVLQIQLLLKKKVRLVQEKHLS